VGEREYEVSELTSVMSLGRIRKRDKGIPVSTVLSLLLSASGKYAKIFV
jgi:hypothetical protein